MGIEQSSNLEEQNQEENFLTLLNASFENEDISAILKDKGDVVESRYTISTPVAIEMIARAEQFEQEDRFSESMEVLEEIYDHDENLQDGLQFKVVKYLASISAKAFQKTPDKDEKLAWTDTIYYWFRRYYENTYHRFPGESFSMDLELAHVRNDHGKLLENGLQKQQLLTTAYNDLYITEGQVLTRNNYQYLFHIVLRGFAKKLWFISNDAEKGVWLQKWQEEAETVISYGDLEKIKTHHFDLVDSSKAFRTLAHQQKNSREKKKYLSLAYIRINESIEYDSETDFDEYAFAVNFSVNTCLEISAVAETQEEKSYWFQKAYSQRKELILLAEKENQLTIAMYQKRKLVEDTKVNQRYSNDEYWKYRNFEASINYTIFLVKHPSLIENTLHYRTFKMILDCLENIEELSFDESEKNQFKRIYPLLLNIEEIPEINRALASHITSLALLIALKCEMKANNEYPNNSSEPSSTEIPISDESIIQENIGMLQNVQEPVMKSNVSFVTHALTTETDIPYGIDGVIRSMNLYAYLTPEQADCTLKALLIPNMTLEQLRTHQVFQEKNELRKIRMANLFATVAFTDPKEPLDEKQKIKTFLTYGLFAAAKTAVFKYTGIFNRFSIPLEDALMEVWGGIPKVINTYIANPPNKFLAAVNKSVENKCIDIIRASARKLTNGSIDTMLETQFDIRSPYATISPEEILLLKEKLYHVYLMLTPTEREVIYPRIYGYTYKELEVKLEKNVDLLHAIVVQARKKLKTNFPKSGSQTPSRGKRSKYDKFL